MAERNKTRSMLRNMGQHAATIRQLRIRSGLTPMQLADKIGVTKSAVYNWENGKGRPDFSILQQQLRFPSSYQILSRRLQVLSPDRIFSGNQLQLYFILILQKEICMD